MNTSYDVTDKTMLITASTSGIGFETARGLAKRGARLILTGRNQQNGERAVQQLRADTKNPHIEVMCADLASMSEVRRLAHEVHNRYPSIDVLINNVGAIYKERIATSDDFEGTLAVNHLGPFLLTHELLEPLSVSEGSRVINVTGGAPPMAKIRLDDLQSTRNYKAMNAYQDAKLVNMAVTLELGRRLRGQGISVFVVYPGMANTSMTQSLDPSMMPWLMRLPMRLMFKLMMSRAKPADAAQSSIWAATTSELEGQTAMYFDQKCRPAKIPKSIRSSEIVDALFDTTKELLGIQADAFDAAM